MGLIIIIIPTNNNGKRYKCNQFGHLANQCGFNQINKYYPNNNNYNNPRRPPLPKNHQPNNFNQPNNFDQPSNFNRRPNNNFSNNFTSPPTGYNINNRQPKIQ